jgi:hypothetical protein
MIRADHIYEFCTLNALNKNITASGMYDNHYLLPLEWVGSVMSCGRIAIRSGDDCKMRMRAESMISIQLSSLISGVTYC